MRITLPNSIVIEDDDPSVALSAAAALLGLTLPGDETGIPAEDLPEDEPSGCTEDEALEVLHIARARPKPVTTKYLARRLGVTLEEALTRLETLVAMGQLERLSESTYRPIEEDIDENESEDTEIVDTGTPADEESETQPCEEPDPFDAIVAFRRDVQSLLPTRRDRETYDLFVSRRKRLSSARAAALLELSPAATGVRLRRLLTLGVIERAGRGSYRAVTPDTRDAEEFLHSALPPEAETETQEPEEAQPAAEAPHRLSVDHRREIQAQLDDDRDRQTYELFVENDAFQSEGTVAGSLSITRRDAEDRLQRLVERGVIGRKPSGYGTYNRYYAID